MKYVYRLYDDQGILLYIGSSKNVKVRLIAHKRTSHWYQSVSKILSDGPHDDGVADRYEGMAIQVERPMHNKNGRRCVFPSLDLSSGIVDHNMALHESAMIRASRVRELRSNGLTFAEVGRVMRISRQRAQQLAAKIQ